MSNVALIAELDRLHHRATDLRAREAQLADAGENDPASDTWKTAAIVAASAECEFHAALVAAWPTISRVLREAAEGCAQKQDTKSYWGWWAGAHEEWCAIGPCETRDEVIANAVDDVLGEFEDDDGAWKLSFHICEAEQRPLRLAEYIEADRFLERAEEALSDSDRVGCEGDDGPWFEATAEQEADLQRRIEAACDAWQEAHGLVFTCQTFSASRNHEHVVVPHPLPEASPTPSPEPATHSLEPRNDDR